MPDFDPTGNRSRSASSRSPPPENCKRRKYTAVACDECRGRKLKCIPSDIQGCCQRCKSKGANKCGMMMSRQRAPNGQAQSNDAVLSLSQDVRVLRETMDNWMAAVKTVSGTEDKHQHAPSAMIPPSARTAPTPRAAIGTPNSVDPRAETPKSLPNPDVVITMPSTSPALSRRAPEEPRFVGPTRSAYSIEVGERALARMGIPQVEMPPGSGQQSPAGSVHQDPDHEEHFWQQCDYTEFKRLIVVFQEEVESVYPCLETEFFVEYGTDILNLVRVDRSAAERALREGNSKISTSDLQLARIIIATATVIEGHGKSEASMMIVDSLQSSALNLLSPSRGLKDLQLLILLSIYYFHTDEDLLAWRTIGLAAREALVMGLHRKTTLMETFPDDKDRSLAVRTFWTIYVLDRRWSFGTSLSFALVDRDIDPELPEPGPEYAYLQCMVGYGRLCSDLWDVLMPFGQRSVENPETKTTELDIKTQEWLESIPAELHLRHPRLSLAARAQPPVLHRLRALLYLRGNHSRTLIYRYYLLGPRRIKTFHKHANLAVEIAKDSIQVLVHLNDTSDIYSRQQAAFNYFLLSAVAVIFLAVCNDPETFAAPCKKSLHSAIDLLRHFSRHSRGSRRLWSSVRGILPRLRRLEMRKAYEHSTSTETTENSRQQTGNLNAETRELSRDERRQHQSGSHEPRANYSGDRNMASFMPDCTGVDSGAAMGPPVDVESISQAGLSSTTPDFTTMSNELIGLFETFEQGQHFFGDQNSSTYWDERMYIHNAFNEDPGDISWQLNWLIQ